MDTPIHDITCSCDSCLDDAYIHDNMSILAIAGLESARTAMHVAKHCIKTPKRDSALLGYMWVNELWMGNEFRFFENMRMRKTVLEKLMNVLQTKCGIVVKRRRVSFEESMAIFLLILGQGLTYPIVEERLQHSSETISNHFHMVLKSVCKLGKYLIRPSSKTFNEVPHHILSSSLYYPYFDKCVGALDGSHIGIHVPEGEKVPWMNRKGYTSTNVIAVCDFDMCFIYANVGMEGSMHDARVFSESVRDEANPFPFPPDGKFFLGDAGYPLMTGILTPYSRTRYHLPEFQESRQFRNRNEAFNYRHSSLRSVIERSFGVLKKRWRILNNMSQVKLKDQIKIIWACLVLHNFIRKYDEDDLILLGDISEFSNDMGWNNTTGSTSDVNVWSNSEYDIMKRTRDAIRDALP